MYWFTPGFRHSWIQGFKNSSMMSLHLLALLSSGIHYSHTGFPLCVPRWLQVAPPLLSLAAAKITGLILPGLNCVRWPSLNQSLWPVMKAFHCSRDHAAWEAKRWGQPCVDRSSSWKVNQGTITTSRDEWWSTDVGLMIATSLTFVSQTSPLQTSCPLPGYHLSSLACPHQRVYVGLVQFTAACYPWDFFSHNNAYSYGNS